MGSFLTRGRRDIALVVFTKAPSDSTSVSSLKKKIIGLRSVMREQIKV